MSVSPRPFLLSREDADSESMVKSLLISLCTTGRRRGIERVRPCNISRGEAHTERKVDNDRCYNNADAEDSEQYSSSFAPLLCMCLCACVCLLWFLGCARFQRRSMPTGAFEVGNVGRFRFGVGTCFSPCGLYSSNLSDTITKQSGDMQPRCIGIRNRRRRYCGARCPAKVTPTTITVRVSAVGRRLSQCL